MVTFSYIRSGQGCAFVCHHTRFGIPLRQEQAGWPPDRLSLEELPRVAQKMWFILIWEGLNFVCVWSTVCDYAKSSDGGTLILIIDQYWTGEHY